MDRKRFDFDSIGEAFRAGNRARRKESVQDAVSDTLTNVTMEEQVRKFNERFGKKAGGKMTIVNDRPYWEGYLEMSGDPDFDFLPDNTRIGGYLEVSDCVNLTRLPKGMTIEGNLYVKDSGITSLPLDLKIAGVWICHNWQLEEFFGKLGISVDSEDGDTEVSDWCKWQKAHGYLTEAFRAGNRARKKESVQDTIEQPYSPEKTIEDFYKITGYKLTYKEGWYVWSGDMRLENNIFSEDYKYKGLKTLPSPLWIGRCLYLKWCKDLEALPDKLLIDGFLSIEYCMNLRSIGEHTKVGTDVYIRGCNSLDRLPLSLRFGRTMHLNDMSAGIVKDTPVITFVKSIGIEPSKWGAVDAVRWPGNRQPVDEAFRAGNRARKKESAVDAANETDAYPGTGDRDFDIYFTEVFPSQDSIEEIDSLTNIGQHEFCRTLRNLINKQFEIVSENQNADPCRMDLDWLRWFKGKLRELPQLIWPSDKAANSVRSIVVPDGVMTLKMMAGVFDNLERIVLPQSLEAIGNDAFEGCTVIRSIELPSGLKTIGQSAFYNTPALEGIHIPAGMEDIKPDAFEESGIREFIMDPACGVTIIERNMCRLCKRLDKIVLGDNVACIKPLAFAFCGEVAEMTVPIGLAKGIIYNDAFKNTRIKTVYIKGEGVRDVVRGLDGFESVRQKVLFAMGRSGDEPEFINIP